MRDWQELSEALVRHLELRGYARATRVQATAELRRWVAFCARHDLGDPRAVTRADLEAYATELARSAYSPSVKNYALYWCRRLFRWAFTQGWLGHDPGYGWQPLRHIAPPTQEVPSAAELATLLAVPERTPLGLRDRAILETLYGAGLRANECRGLDLADVDLRGHQLHIRHAKGGRPRLVPTGERLAQVLAEYLRLVRPLLGPPQAGVMALFVSRYGRRMHPSGYRKLLKKAVARAGLSGRVTLHTLRHAFASHLVERDAPLEAVSELLGHACLRSTERYAHVSAEQLARVIRAKHPRGGEP